MESLEPKPITRRFWVACIVVPVLAVGAMVLTLMNPGWLPAKATREGPLNASFTVPGEFSARSLSDFRGRVLVVTLWRTTDCPDCLLQLTTLDELALRYGREGLMAIALSDQDSLTLMSYPALRGLSVMTGHIERVQADVLPAERPYTMILDRQGNVRQERAGHLAAKKVEDLVEDLLGR